MADSIETKKATFTPGPWDIAAHHDQDRNRLLVSIWGHGPAARPKIASVWSTPNQEANARLIAAAPDLLAALKVALESMEVVDGENDCSKGIDAAEAAIAKAEG